MGTQVGTSMKILHSLLLALSLAGAAVSAQSMAAAVAPAVPAAAQTAPAVAPTVTTAPAPVIEPGAVPAAADAKATPPAYVSTYKPDPHIGQPEPGGWKLPVQVTPTGERALWMHNVILMPLIVIISLFVLGLLLWVMFRFRAAANPNPGKTTHNTFIEVVWTLVPVLILVAIAVPSISLLAEQFKTPPKNAVTIKAIGNQWYWTYEYPDNGGFELTANMLKEKKDAAPGERFRTDADGVRLLATDNHVVLPVGVPIRVLVTSNDVIHSWSMPAFWAKLDGVPGRINQLSFTIERPGLYYGQCSELCGARHGFMPITVEAVSPAQFAAWVASKGGTMPGATPPSGAAAPEAAAPAAATEAPAATNQTDAPAAANSTEG